MRPADPLDLPTFETARLILRPYTMADVDAAYEMNRDPEVSRYTGDGGPQSRAEIERIVRDVVLADYRTHGFGRYAVVLKATGRYIGFCGLKAVPAYGGVDLGYRLARAHWGRGLATEACRPFLGHGFAALGLDRIIALAMPQNGASIRVLEKLGFAETDRFVEDGERIVRFEVRRP